MSQKPQPKVGLLFGGPSSEHAISCLSAQSIWSRMDESKYEKCAIAWMPNGLFYISEKIEDLILPHSDPRLLSVQPHQSPVSLSDLNLDVLFPIGHGKGVEDGALAGMLSILGIPFVGADIKGCALSWHKGICKEVLQAHVIPVTPWFSLRRGEPTKDILNSFSYPLFVKPASSGSAIGVSRVTDDEGLFEALETAWVEDKDIVIEPEIIGRELECALLNDRASPVGEIVKHTPFYDFEAKYVDRAAATPTVTPDLNPDLEKKIQDISLKAARILGTSSFCRVDFFWDEVNGKLYLNEINTYPGFTDISMYPKLWEKAGYSMSQLIDELLGQALRKSSTSS